MLKQVQHDGTAHALSGSLVVLTSAGVGGLRDRHSVVLGNFQPDNHSSLDLHSRFMRSIAVRGAIAEVGNV